MKFKDFILNEAGFSDSGSDWFYGNYLYPSDAFDWEDAVVEPQDFRFVQKRWDKESKFGRKFHNIDLKKVVKTKFTSVYSNTMPEPGDGFWINKSDNRPNVRIDNDAQLVVQSDRKKADVPQYPVANNQVDLTKDLNRLFGDFSPAYPKVADNFDEPWNNYQGSTKMNYKKIKKNKKWNNIG